MSDEIPSGKEEESINFSWWLCMLPFLVASGICVYKWTSERADTHWLLYALLTMAVGLVFTAAVAGSAIPKDKSHQDNDRPNS